MASSDSPDLCRSARCWGSKGGVLLVLVLPDRPQFDIMRILHCGPPGGMDEPPAGRPFSLAASSPPLVVLQLIEIIPSRVKKPVGLVGRLKGRFGSEWQVYSQLVHLGE